MISDHAAFALGVARRALDEILELSPSKSRGYAEPTMIAASSTFQRDIGRADLELRAARELVVSVLEEAWESCCSGVVPPPPLQSRLRSAAVLATEVGAEVAGLALRYGGGASIYSSVALQRCFRDRQRRRPAPGGAPVLLRKPRQVPPGHDRRQPQRLEPPGLFDTWGKLPSPIGRGVGVRDVFPL